MGGLIERLFHEFAVTLSAAIFRDCFVNAHADVLRPFFEKRGATRFAPLNAIGFFAAAVETALLIWLSLDKRAQPIERSTNTNPVGSFASAKF